MSLLLAIPVKPFGVAKARLSPVLDARRRSLLGKRIAAHTVGEAGATGARVAVVTGNTGVAAWAGELGVEVIGESGVYGTGLNGAATAATTDAGRTGSDWMILHADLPHLTRRDLTEAIDRFAPGRYVLAPSYNGGTTLLMGTGPFAFHYGPGSFHHHLRSAGQKAEVLVRRGLALDLDTPNDLETARTLGMTWQKTSA
ncbi:MAG: 2-phospho-L-lactate guanylyltransferase [Acidimicrobiia bacterium]|nr:2-phospho-L-lactate guanylyltransferase [Acidimicrobiia bacterium]